MKLTHRGKRLFPAFKPRPAQAEKLSGLPRINRVSYVPDRNGDTVPACTVASGTHRCRGADLVIIDDFLRLTQSTSDEEQAVHLLYILGTGIPVTTFPMFVAQGSDVRKLTAKSVMQWVPLVRNNVELRLARGFRSHCSEVYAALRACVDASGGKWNIVREFSHPARGGNRLDRVEVENILGITTWITQNAKLTNRRGQALCWRNGAPGF